MELLIYSAFILFILGVSATIFIDKAKAKREEHRPTSSPRASKKTPHTTNSAYFDELLKEVKSRQKLGQTSVQVQSGTKTETMSVQDLIKRLEQMKKSL